MASELHLSLSAETLVTVGGFHITNSIATSLIVTTLLIIFGFIVRAKLTNTTKPSGIQNVAEFIVESLFSFVSTTTNDYKKSLKFFPFIATFFLFIILNNWFGLLPGVGSIGLSKTEDKPAVEIATETTSETLLETSANESETIEPEHAKKEFIPLFRAGTADLNTTIALALISILMVQIFGFTHLSIGYLTKYFNFESPIMFFVGLLELVSEFSKILSFAFRLFGNIFAGEVLLAVMGVLAPVLVPIPFYGLELFVGFIQALVFSLLSLVFFNMATQGHEAH